jgi:hypothetical protein
MTETALRKEIIGYIETISERKLAALKPLLSELAGEEPQVEESIIESANFWERLIHNYRSRQMDRNPEKYAIQLKNIK